MDILNSLLEQMPFDAIPVRKVLVGAHWTAVCSRGCGLASTLTGDGPHGHHRVRDVGRLHEKSAQELAEWIKSDNLLEASIGMAALNSVLAVDETSGVEMNAADVLAQKGKDRNIAIIGHFPFVDRLQALARNVWIIEKRPGEGDLPEQAAQDYLPQADIVAITGTALINHTLESLLALCPPGAFVMVLGPSTPLTPVLFNYGIHVISGTRVLDESSALLTIQQGAIFPQVQGVKLLSLAAADITKG
jgi:uncharacterized protein